MGSLNKEVIFKYEIYWCKPLHKNKISSSFVSDFLLKEKSKKINRHQVLDGICSLTCCKSRKREIIKNLNKF